VTATFNFVKALFSIIPAFWGIIQDLLLSKAEILLELGDLIALTKGLHNLSEAPSVPTQAKMKLATVCCS
jgi:hypothetical protein